MDHQATHHATPLDNMTPRQIVEELDRYVIGQKDAKRMVAIALRNRWRRQQLSPELREEIFPKNIVMIGPTGVGKTEISRRLAKLADAPFIKVEASKFTEVGYVGRDVESIIRDLTELSVNMVKSTYLEKVQRKADEMAEERVLDLLLPPPLGMQGSMEEPQDEEDTPPPESNKPKDATRSKLRLKLRDGKLDDRSVEIEVKERGLPVGIISNVGGMEDLENNLREMLGGLMPGKKKNRRMKVSEALKYLAHEEAQKLIDMDEVTKEAITRTEQSGIVFLDEIDKIAGREKSMGPDVSREGVQRDLSADRGRVDREHQARTGSHRPHSVCRSRGLSRRETLRPDSGAARTFSHSGRIRTADQRRSHPDFDGTAKCPGQAVSSTSGNRRHQS